MAWIMVRSPPSLWNCLGESRRDSGHRRVPTPPDMMTGTIDTHRRVEGRSRGDHRSGETRVTLFDHSTRRTLESSGSDLPTTVADQSDGPRVRSR